MTEKNENSNIHIRRECVDPQGAQKGFPCAFRIYNNECRWKGEAPCRTIRINWYIEKNIDNLKELKL